MKEKIKISTYLYEYNNPNLQTLLKNYALTNVSIDLFFKYFENRVKQNPKEVVEFILDEKNGYELSMLGHRASGEMNFLGYNGKSNYRGSKCTVAARHSRFHE